MEREFKKFGGEIIKDLGQYVREHMETFPDETIYVGCDSDSRRNGRKIMYADVIAFYDHDKRAGVHYIFNRESLPGNPVKVKKTGNKAIDKKAIKKALSSTIFQKIWLEVERLKEIGYYFEKELDGIYPRKSPEELVEMGFKSHQNKLVDLDVDINPIPGWTPSQFNLIDAGLDPGLPQNRSNIVYEAAKAFLEGEHGFRVRYKPNSWASKCAADMICKGGKA